MRPRPQLTQPLRARRRWPPWPHCQEGPGSSGTTLHQHGERASYFLAGSPPRSPSRPIICRPREPHRLAGPPHGHPVLLHQHNQDLSVRGRRHPFRLKTSLIAAFSSASSAYIRLSFAFSVSSSRGRFSSSTDAPAYFDRFGRSSCLRRLAGAALRGEEGARLQLWRYLAHASGLGGGQAGRRRSTRR